MTNATPDCRPCPTCGKVIHRLRMLRGGYCSRACAYPKTPRSIGSRLGLDTGRVGAMGELLAATDLIRRGFYVYRSVSATAPCDIVAFRRGKTPRKVEVKIASVGSDGRLQYFRPRGRHDFDLLALITPDGHVVYQPEIEGTGSTKKGSDLPATPRRGTGQGISRLPGFP